MAARTILVLGGQRSGKSRYAEEIIAASGLSPVYLATATAGDAEMAERIAGHRVRRGTGWTLIEEPLELAGALRSAARKDTAVLVDCLTLWVSNLLGCGRTTAGEAEGLLSALSAVEGKVVVVSNEVGAGIIPANPLARRYADDLGLLNQRIAAAVDTVVLMVAGLPVFVKQGAAS
jgi:adenosylcobinamide kinase/adenosylcobinamide-phosphate guanylyltransferase